jgi:uncharacterized protein YbjT (DUF2867 family)
MLLLTGAGGQTGEHVLKHLNMRGIAVRALVRSEQSARKVQAQGAAEAVLGDMNRYEDLHRAVRGVDRVYHICPAMVDTEVDIGRSLIEAAKAAGVRHFIYHSVLHAQIDAMPHHRNKRSVEAMLMESLLPYTVLQPAMYMQTTTRGWKEIVEHGRYVTEYSADRQMAMVDLEDVGEVAAAVVTGAEFTGGCFELASGEALTRSQMAALMSEALGRPVTAEKRDLQDWIAEQRRLAVLAPAQIERRAAMSAH